MSINSTAEATLTHEVMMDRNYRLQRHVYDASRKYYLLGRDEMLDHLAPPPGGRVLEIGCGTARNLIGVARRYPAARLFGLDISEQMLLTAGNSLRREGIDGRVRLARGDAAGFDAKAAFGEAEFERVYFSYALSMIPEWQAALAQAARLLGKGGELHVVDFGSCERLPRLFKAGLHAWLKRFHVSPRALLAAELARLAAEDGRHLTITRPYRDYAVIAVLRGA